MALYNLNTTSSGSFQVTEPFLDPAADVLLRSSDDALFRVHRAMLTVGSGFFRDMLALPQPKTEVEDIIIAWEEPAAVIDCLLRFAYPIEEPTIAAVDQIFDVIRAADKWQFEGPRLRLLAILLQSRLVQDHGMDIYSFFCEMGYDEKDKIA
ncbi:hypothetical protein CALCODRAFT_432812, partial [Calocera cornea HHB12733]